MDLSRGARSGRLRRDVLLGGVVVGAALAAFGILSGFGGAEPGGADLSRAAEGSNPPLDPDAAVPLAAEPHPAEPSALVREAARVDLSGSAETARRLRGSFVRVSLALRYDEGEAPHADARTGESLETLVKEDRPLLLPAYLVASDRVLLADPGVDPRFVSRISVSHDAETVGATPAAWATDRAAMFLALERPLAGGRPLVFGAIPSAPRRALSYSHHAGRWGTLVETVSARVFVDEDGTASLGRVEPSLVVGGDDAPLGITMDGWLRLDGAFWRGSPTSWPVFTAAERDTLVARTRERASAGLLRVRIRLRSPKVGQHDPRSARALRSDDEARVDTERTAAGVLLARRLVLVLDRLDARTTARVETVEVASAAGRPVTARFRSSYRDFGAFLVETEEDLGGPLELSTTRLRTYQNDFLLCARLDLRGERHAVRCASIRVDAFVEGWQGRTAPSLRGSAADHFLFDRQGRLVAIPILRRVPAQEEDRWRRPDVVLLAAEDLASLLARPAEHSDPAIAPVPTEREGCRAWLGVETQPLDREIARANEVSHWTQEGKTGLLVSYVYAGSPAYAAGLEPGHVLLRLEVPGRPAPVALEEPPRPPFPRESAAGYTPWPSTENAVNRVLTEIGVGARCVLEYAVGGRVRRAEMLVAESPVHFETAPAHVSDDLGATVRDLTYEVRRHYQMEAETSAVIVSKVERGSRAAVAGLRRFDVVLEVNGRPVADAGAFGKAIAERPDVRLTVRDRLRQRLLRIAPR